jgi:hypothetical protein
MKALRIVGGLVALIVVVLAAVVTQGVRLGFSERTEPSSIEKLLTQAASNCIIRRESFMIHLRRVVMLLRF